MQWSTTIALSDENAVKRNALAQQVLNDGKLIGHSNLPNWGSKIIYENQQIEMSSNKLNVNKCHVCCAMPQHVCMCVSLGCFVAYGRF